MLGIMPMSNRFPQRTASVVLAVALARCLLLHFPFLTWDHKRKTVILAQKPLHTAQGFATIPRMLAARVWMTVLL